MEKIYCCFWGFLLLCVGSACRVPEARVNVVVQPDSVAPKGVDSSVLVAPPSTPAKDTVLILKDTVIHKDTVTIVKDTAVVLKPTVLLKKRPSVSSVYLSQVGVREATGNNDGKSVERYLRSVGLGKGYAWCAAFVRWCYDSAGVKTSINGAAASAHNPKGLVFFKKKELLEPRAGDVFTLWYSQLNRIGHTGFFHKSINSSVYESCEGNTNEAGSREGDGVYKKYRSLNATYSISRWGGN